MTSTGCYTLGCIWFTVIPVLQACPSFLGAARSPDGNDYCLRHGESQFGVWRERGGNIGIWPRCNASLVRIVEVRVDSGAPCIRMDRSCASIGTSCLWVAEAIFCFVSPFHAARGRSAKLFCLVGVRGEQFCSLRGVWSEQLHDGPIHRQIDCSATSCAPTKRSTDLAQLGKVERGKSRPNISHRWPLNTRWMCRLPLSP